MKLFANSVMEIKSGQAALRENQAELKENQEELINRLFQIESDMTKMKEDTDILKEQQTVLNDEVEAAKSAIDVVEYKSWIELIDRQEQFSHKNSVRVFDLTENDEEILEELRILEELKEEKL